MLLATPVVPAGQAADNGYQWMSWANVNTTCIEKNTLAPFTISTPLTDPTLDMESVRPKRSEGDLSEARNGDISGSPPRILPDGVRIGVAGGGIWTDMGGDSSTTVGMAAPPAVLPAVLSNRCFMTS